MYFLIISLWPKLILLGCWHVKPIHLILSRYFLCSLESPSEVEREKERKSLCVCVSTKMEATGQLLPNGASNLILRQGLLLGLETLYLISLSCLTKPQRFIHLHFFSAGIWLCDIIPKFLHEFMYSFLCSKLLPTNTSLQPMNILCFLLYIQLWIKLYLEIESKDINGCVINQKYLPTHMETFNLWVKVKYQLGVKGVCLALLKFAW